MQSVLDTAQPLIAISLSGKRWSLRAGEDAQATALAREMDIPQLLACVLLGRGVAPEAAADFLQPSLRAAMPDPSHLKDMDVAAERLAAAIIGNETIAIFGDYDVDGATSSALLARFFESVGNNPIVYIPDRMLEGYGPNTAALLALKQRGASVIVTVDCGTLSHEPIAAAHEAGVDVIVVDHHLSEARRPKAYALINPNRLDETSPHGNLAAVGVAFLLAAAVQRQLRRAGHFNERREPDLLSLLDLVALGTVCDVVPLTGLNRAYVAQGLKVMTGRGNLGIKTLLDVARVDERPGTYHAGFIIGPRVNAGGRVGKSDFGAQLLSTADEALALNLAQALDRMNEERKAIEAMVLEQAQAQAMLQEAEPVMLLCANGWHPGVIGIVAGRIKETFGRPVAVVALDGGLGKASARSVPGFDFGAAVIAATESGLLLKGGGHAMAAGFSVEEGKLPALHAFLNRRFALKAADAEAARSLKIDGCVTLAGATPELVEALERAGPFGQGNPSPRLMFANVTVVNVQPVGKEGAHLRLTIVDESRARLAAMAFRTGGTAFGKQLAGLTGRRVHIAGHLRLRFWQNAPQVSLNLDDVAMA